MKPWIAPTALSLALLGGGCTKHVLRAPIAVKDARELPVQGYSSGFRTSFREKDIHVGDYLVTGIDRDFDQSSQQNAGGFQRLARKSAYRFELKAAAHALHGECTAEYESRGKAGFAKVTSSFHCWCAEDNTPRADVTITNGTGRAQIIGNAYALTVLHQPQSGGPVKAALGYQFKSPGGALGAVDVTGNGRVWLPAGSSADESTALVCSYAGLMLYRPAD
ncbi:MAG: hypothetical protein QM778_38805 [Myxococcales bacterium]